MNETSLYSMRYS